MISKYKIRQLEKKCDQILSADDSGVQAIRHITYTGYLVDENGYRLCESEIRTVEKKDGEIFSKGGKVVYLTRYSDPLEKPVSVQLN